MSALTTDGIRDHATRLGLTHLTEVITAMVTRAETQMGYLDSSTRSWKKNSACAKAAGSATPSNSPGYPRPNRPDRNGSQGSGEARPRSGRRALTPASGRATITGPGPLTGHGSMHPAGALSRHLPARPLSQV